MQVELNCIIYYVVEFNVALIFCDENQKALDSTVLFCIKIYIFEKILDILYFSARCILLIDGCLYSNEKL